MAEVFLGFFQSIWVYAIIIQGGSHIVDTLKCFTHTFFTGHMSQSVWILFFKFLDSFLMITHVHYDLHFV
jgi:hypothetical protein